MVEILSVYRMDENNIGDSFSSPALYFPFLEGRKMDIGMAHTPDGFPKIRGRIIVVGGGGLADHEFFMARGCVSVIPSLSPRGTVIWGCGTNSRTGFPDYAAWWRYDLVGCRDWGVSRDWVPCASCMSPIFDEIRSSVVHPVVKFVHLEHKLVGVPANFPEMNNSGKDLEKTLRFLASGDVVVTNTYHGAYWATLLGRKVVVVNPWSGKFLYMKHRPVISDGSDISDVNRAIKKAVAYPGALEECRGANVAFSLRVGKLIESIKA